MYPVPDFAPTNWNVHIAIIANSILGAMPTPKEDGTNDQIANNNYSGFWLFDENMQ
jgi:hypothetical protein